MRTLAAIGVSCLLGFGLLTGQERSAQDDGWIQEDLEAGLAKAKETGKPLLVAFR